MRNEIHKSKFKFKPQALIIRHDCDYELMSSSTREATSWRITCLQIARVTTIGRTYGKLCYQIILVPNNILVGVVD